MSQLPVTLLFALLWPATQQAPPRDQPPPRDRTAPSATASISGRVYAAGSGAPVQGVIVVLTPAPVLDSQSAATGRKDLPRADDAGRSAVTGASGEFLLAGIAPGLYRLIATPAGYRGRYLAAGHGAVQPNDPGKPITVRPGADIRHADIFMPIGLAIEGRVLDEAGEPLSRVPVFAARLMAGSDTPQRASHAPVVTDDLGRYRIYGLEPGTYLVAAEGRSLMTTPVQRLDGRMFSASFADREPVGFVTTFHPANLAEASAQRILLTAPRDTIGIDVVLTSTRRFQLSGTVLDSEGRPALRTTGVLVQPGLATIGSFPFNTDADGRFFLRALDPGHYRLLVGGGMWTGLIAVNGRTEFAEMAIVLADDLTDVVVMTQPGIGLSGRVVFADGPPAAAPSLRIAFRRPDGSPTRNSEIVATFDDALRFYGSDVFGPQLVRVSALPPGWVVKAVTLGGIDITDVPTVFTREHDGQLQVVLATRASTLEGGVRDETGAIAGDATVYVFSEDRAAWRMSSPRTVFTDVGENGRFTAAGLVAGRYYAIAVAREGFRMPPNPGEAFFDLLSKEATGFVIGDDERRTLDLRLWRWPE